MAMTKSFFRKCCLSTQRLCTVTYDTYFFDSKMVSWPGGYKPLGS